MTVSEQQSETGRFEASPVVTVGCFGHQLSITEAQMILAGISNRIKLLLLPADGWVWEDLETPEHMREWVRQNKPAVSRLFPPSDDLDPYPTLVGFVHKTPSGLFEARIGTEDMTERKGLTNDLNDAKYLVAEAIRVRRAGQNVEDPPGV